MRQGERKKCRHPKARQTDPVPAGSAEAGAAWGCEGHRGYEMVCEHLEQSPWFKIHRKGSGVSISGEERHAFIHEEAFALRADPGGGDKSLPPALENGNFP